MGNRFVWKNFGFQNSKNDFIKIGLKLGFNRLQGRGFGIITLLNSSRIYLENIKIRLRCQNSGIKILGDQEWNVDSVNGK